MSISVEIPVVHQVVPVLERKYSFETGVKFIPTKSKQRNVVLGILSESKNPMTVKEISDRWMKEFRTVKVVNDRFQDSVRYHLHVTGLLKITKYV